MSHYLYLTDLFCEHIYIFRFEEKQFSGWVGPMSVLEARALDPYQAQWNTWMTQRIVEILRTWRVFNLAEGKPHA